MMLATLLSVFSILVGCTDAFGAQEGASRAIDVTVHVQDHEGNPVSDVPATVLTRMWEHVDDGVWARRTDELGNARIAISTDPQETHVVIDVAGGWGTPDPRDTIWEHQDFEDAVYDRWAVPRPRPIDISSGAVKYEYAVVLRPKIVATVVVKDEQGQRVHGGLFGSLSVVAGNELDLDPETERPRPQPILFDGVAQGMADTFLGFIDVPSNPHPMLIEVEASETTGPTVSVSAEMRSYEQTTAMVDLKVGRYNPMVYSRAVATLAVTLISADGSLVYCFPRSIYTDGRSYVYDTNTVQDPMSLSEEVPTVQPGRYFIAPGSLGYEPTLKLYRYIKAGNDPTGSIMEFTAVEGQTFEATLDYVQLEADIIELLGL